MSVSLRGRVLRGPANAAGTTAPATPRMDAGASGRRIARAELEARERARAIVAEAEERARAIGREAAARAAEEARAAEHAKLAATYLRLKAASEAAAERDVERSVELAVILAERLLGEELEKHPEKCALLARQALAEARGARRVRIECCPLDADALRAQVDALGMPRAAVEIAPTPDLSRGSLVFHTDLGTLDAKLAPQLDRLAAALRDALRPA